MANRSTTLEATIALGAMTSNVLDFKHNYRSFVLHCDDSGGIPGGTAMNVYASVNPEDDLVDLYERDDPSTQWSSVVSPNGFQFIFSHAEGSRFLQLELDAVTTAEVVIAVTGMGKDISHWPPN